MVPNKCIELYSLGNGFDSPTSRFCFMDSDFLLIITTSRFGDKILNNAFSLCFIWPFSNFALSFLLLFSPFFLALSLLVCFSPYLLIFPIFCFGFFLLFFDTSPSSPSAFFLLFNFSSFFSLYSFASPFSRIHFCHFIVT